VGDYIVPEQPGILYVVATPIGNLADISLRAKEVLSSVDLVAAEDTRHSRKLLTRLGLDKKLISLHEHNEIARVPRIIEMLTAGHCVALISDAGTPLLSDPGYRLLKAVREQGLQAMPVPGPSALTAALSIAGLPTDKFVFEGFLPAKSGARTGQLKALLAEPRTMVFYEAPHRLRKALDDMSQIFGGDRSVCVAREMTKQYETIYNGTLDELAAQAKDDRDMCRGELVIVVSGADELAAGGAQDVIALLTALLTELSPAKAARIASRVSGLPRPEVYALATKLAGD
jgi:16S rRNA (cytidine1402-2'-O)-methyltransferase